MYRLEDVELMRAALRLAAEGTGLASPNPRVGAVVVREGKIIGRGSHRYADLDHAEVVALREAGEGARGAALYVNLEPCCHTGRTPPCVEAVIAAGIERVVVGMCDPNPRVGGEGLRRLAAAGVKVESDCLGREAQRLNEDFACWIRSGRPWVTLKAAVSLDGRIAAASPPDPLDARVERKWISSQPSRDRVQEMRHACDAVLSGIGTVLCDDPLLTDRTGYERRRPLLRVVVDSHLRLAVTAQILKQAKRRKDVWVFHVDGTAERQAALEKAGARVEMAAGPDGRVDLATVLRRLGEEQVISVLLEAGARLNGAMLAAGLVDRLTLFQAPVLLGEEALPLVAGTPAWPRQPVGALTCETVGPDVMMECVMSEVAQ
ncbi:MAG TPA: bifunctional diaminohydroxyphosphoribosylaminopyrimidine deaminase/5-amino-6-(5-phosphoribosylamino)uracil reductase RibD [Terriglobales bacterium]